MEPTTATTGAELFQAMSQFALVSARLAQQLFNRVLEMRAPAGEIYEAEEELLEVLSRAHIMIASLCMEHTTPAVAARQNLDFYTVCVDLHRRGRGQASKTALARCEVVKLGREDDRSKPIASPGAYLDETFPLGWRVASGAN